MDNINYKNTPNADDNFQSDKKSAKTLLLKTLDTVFGTLGLGIKPEKAMIDAMSYYQLDDKGVNILYDIFENEYGEPLQYINKMNVLKATLKELGKHAIGIDPDDSVVDLARETEANWWYPSDLANWRYKTTSDGNKDFKPNKEHFKYLINLNEQKYDLLTDEGESILSDIIDRGLHQRSGINKFARENYMHLAKKYYPGEDFE